MSATWYPVEWRRQHPVAVYADDHHVAYVCPCDYFAGGHADEPRYLLEHVGRPVYTPPGSETDWTALAIARREDRNYRCERGHLWHVLDDGTWHYEGNVRSVPADLGPHQLGYTKPTPRQGYEDDIDDWDEDET